jgi:hypothetical protein
MSPAAALHRSSARVTTLIAMPLNRYALVVVIAWIGAL